MNGADGSSAALKRLLSMAVVIACGTALAAALRAWTPVEFGRLWRGNGFGYNQTIAVLLAVGLYAATYGISRQELRESSRIVLLAVTAGVAAKALLTGAVMFLFYRTPASWLLGVAVAQIDPLSVAATLKSESMSKRAKAILSAWASFDDPVTVLFTAYLAAPLLRGSDGQDVASAGILHSGGTSAYLLNLGGNALLAAVAFAAWLVRRSRRGRAPRAERGAPDRSRKRPWTVLAIAILAAFVAIAAWGGLFLGIAAVGLFFRPAISSLLERTVTAAFYAAAFLLGIFILGGVDLRAGITLGLGAYAAQIVVGAVLTRGLPRRDRADVSFGQQNGLTAIVLALALRPYYPDAVRIITVAVLTVNLTNIIFGLILSRCRRTLSRPGTDTAVRAEPETFAQFAVAPTRGR